MWLIIKTTNNVNSIFTAVSKDIPHHLIKTLINGLQNAPGMYLDGKLIEQGSIFSAIEISNSPYSLTSICSDLDYNATKIADFGDQLIEKLNNQTIAEDLTTDLISKLKAKI